VARPDRVVVFLDYQNVYRGARRAFHAEADHHCHGQVDPLRLGLHLSQDSPFDRELVQVRIYRGMPAASRDSRGYGACRRQVAAWTSSRLVEVTLRALRYPPGWPDSSLPGERPQEKGIDVALAMDLVLMAGNDFDVAILMSTDTDLKPALEYIAGLTDKAGTPRAEVAAWSAPRRVNARLAIRSRKLFCHWLGEDTYRTIADTTDYTP
jgi:uncharacterized LabA/DUF88 family protein